MKASLVLDTTEFVGLQPSKLRPLVDAGHRVSVSEVAFSQRWAQSLDAFRRGTARAEARRMMFGRVKAFARIVDADYPVAVVGNHLYSRVKALVAGDADIDPSRQAATLRASWQRCVSIEPDDDEWELTGVEVRKRLEHLDAMVVQGMTRDGEFRDRLATVEDPERRAELGALISSDRALRLSTIRSLLKDAWRIEDAYEQHYDACLSWWAMRGMQIGRGARSHAHGDGPDFRLLQHLAEGFVLVTSDERLIAGVRESGTSHAAWVRHPDDLSNLPTELPWEAPTSADQPL